jgi:hypothetical protein
MVDKYKENPQEQLNFFDKAAHEADISIQE